MIPGSHFLRWIPRPRVRNEPGGSSGFTLIELLLVVVIVLVAAGLAAVTFSGSYHATRLRMASRDVIALGRYARSRSVLDGREVHLHIDREGGTASVWVRSTEGDEAAGADDEAVLHAPAGEGSFELTGIRRRLPDGVRFVRIEIQGEEPAPQDVCVVRFYPSGASDRVRIRVEDDAGRYVELDMDGAGGWRVDP